MSSSILQCCAGKKGSKRILCEEMAAKPDQQKEETKITRKRRRNSNFSSNNFERSYIEGLGLQSDRLEDAIVRGLDTENEKELISGRFTTVSSSVALCPYGNTPPHILMQCLPSSQKALMIISEEKNIYDVIGQEIGHHFD